MWVRSYFLKPLTGPILSKFSLSTNLFVETYPINKKIGVPISIDFKNKYAYITTSILSTSSIYKIKLIKE